MAQQQVLSTVDEIVAACLVVIEEHGSVGLGYVRISNDEEGLEHGVTAQEEDCFTLAAKDDIPIVKVFRDNDISASTLSKKPRPDYDMMLAVIPMLPKGTVTVYAYSNSRLTRRPKEFDYLIELHQTTGVVFQTMVSGKDDLATADGRMVARIKADIDAGEAERTSERVSRRITQFRREGISGPGGARPFGYEKGSTVIRETEADAIRAGAQILLLGGTPGDVQRAWTDAGITPVKAQSWSRRTIVGIYRSPRIAGLLEWEGVLKPSVNVPAILERPEWEAVRECLAAKPDGAFARPPGWWSTTSLLTGLLRCGACGHRMGSKGPHYGCLSVRGGCGSNFRNKKWVDQLVSDAMDAAVATLPEASDATSTADDVLATAQEIERLETLIVDTLASVRSGLVSSQDGFPLVSATREEINVLRKQEATAVQEAASKIDPNTALELWRSNDLAKRRRALASEIKMVVIHPLGKRNGYGRHRPLPVESVDILWT